MLNCWAIVESGNIPLKTSLISSHERYEKPRRAIVSAYIVSDFVTYSSKFNIADFRTSPSCNQLVLTTSEISIVQKQTLNCF